jgi:hypothetical protein
MWSRQRAQLRRAAEDALPEPAYVVHAADIKVRTSAEAAECPEQKKSGAVQNPRSETSTRRPRRGRGPGPKRVAFESALACQVRHGDLRLFSEDERERNAAAYDAAASLPAPLSRGTARRYVVQALPRLEGIGAFNEQPKAHTESGLSTPGEVEHQA